MLAGQATHALAFGPHDQHRRAGHIQLIQLLLDLAGGPSGPRGGGTVRVSPCYASPEVATAGEVGAAADLYSAGALLFWLVTGRPPFEGADPNLVLRAQVSAPPPAPSGLVRGLPAERAVNLLKVSDKKAAHLIKKVVESAIANAENNQGADVDELKVKTIMVDEGPMLKRFMARAKGRGTRILKRTSHITVVVGEGK